MKVMVQWRSGEDFVPGNFATCPRQDEYVFWAGKRFRVCQVQHRGIGDAYVPHLILQEERG